MARKAKSTDIVVPKASNKALTTIDQEIAQEAALLKQQIGQPSGNVIKVKPTGNFIAPDGFDLGNEIHIVVLDFISANRFYSGPYDPNNPAPPVCFAFGKIIANMEPDTEAPEKQADKCGTCALNQFGSGNNGKSKACKNTRELAFLIVDPENPEDVTAPDAPIYTMSLPPTAIRSFDGVVGAIDRALGGTPIKAIITVRANNVGTYAAISFTDPMPNPHYAQHFARRGECQPMLFRKPDPAAFAARQATRPAPRRGGAAPQRAATGGRR